MTRPTRRLMLLLPLLAAACGDDPPASRPLTPLHYDYLTPIRLNVASVGIQPEQADPGADPLTSPDTALRAMARDRLLPGGSTGRAVFVIDEARLTRDGSGLNGAMAVHLDILTTDGAKAGFAEARVSRRRTSTDRAENPQTVRYDLVRQMMDDMNVEFEFQVKRSLKDWLQETTTAPAPAPVQQQELSAPGRPAP